MTMKTPLMLRTRKMSRGGRRHGWTYTKGMMRLHSGSGLRRGFSLFGRTALALCLTGALGTAGLIAIAHGAIAEAQQKPRSVTGKVIDKADTPLKGSVVYLKDDHSLAVKSFIADDSGAFRFGQLSQSTDYELWAEFNGKKSNTRTISSFDSKSEFVMNLKVDTGK